MATWVYDPVNEALTVAEPLPQQLGGGVRLATLPDGRVLAAGGEGDGQALADAWVWDAQTASWGRTGAMTVGRVGPTLLPLSDGRVLAAGGGINAPGFEGAFKATGTVEVYDPAAGRWSEWGALPELSVRLVILEDGRLLSFAVGDRRTDGVVRTVPPAAADEVVLIDLGQGTRIPLGASLLRTDRDAALLLPNGTVLTVDELGDVRQFDVTSGWRSLGRLQVARSGATFAALPDGRLFVAGGRHAATSSWLDSAELFDPRTGSSSSIQMPVEWLGTGVRLADGSVLLAGAEQAASEAADCRSDVLRWVP
jgi:hypothetical protein